MMPRFQLRRFRPRMESRHTALMAWNSRVVTEGLIGSDALECSLELL